MFNRKSTTRSNLRTSLGLEPLESRSLMAGNVLVNLNAALSRWELIGDGMSNDVQVQSSAAGGLEAVGLNGTTLNGAAVAVQLGTVDDLFASLGNGDDRLGITNANGVNDLRNLSVTTGQGADTVEITEAYVRGSVNLNTGPGDDLVDAHLQIRGNLNIVTGAGNDVVDVRGNTGLALLANSQIDPEYVFAGGGGIGGGSLVNIDLGIGHDKLIFNNGVDGNLRINLGAGDDVATIWSTQVAGSTLFRGEAGADECSVENTDFSGPAAFRMGDGDDTLTIDNGTYVLSTGAFGFDGGLGAGDILDRSGNVFGVVVNFETLL